VTVVVGDGSSDGVVEAGGDVEAGLGELVSAEVVGTGIDMTVVEIGSSVLVVGIVSVDGMIDAEARLLAEDSDGRSVVLVCVLVFVRVLLPAGFPVG
jgi:uncharacterized ion transporter superfamily protein YfcC